MKGTYLPFVDWLKAVGMLLILYGHLAGWAPLADFPPIYTKQLGVAFFMFASGYGLSGETRDRWHVAFNRLFEMYLFGLAVAVLVSLVLLSEGRRPQPSNYLPFTGGANVLFNNFPANPTTWYLGTYVHLIVLWTLVMYRVRVTGRVLAISLACEILVRAVLLQTAGQFVAYMLLPNWSTVFLLGCWYRQHPPDTQPLAGTHHARWSPRHIAAVATLAVVGVGWPLAARALPFDHTFPFMGLPIANPAAEALVISTLISAIYCGVTWLMFLSVRPLGAPWPVRFVARNTLIIFLAHMPLYNRMLVLNHTWGLGRPMRSTVFMIVCLPGLALASEALYWAIRPRDLRDRVYQRLRPYLPGASAN